MTETPQQLRWETPVSDAKSLAMVSLVDDGNLHLVVQDVRDPRRARFRITFRRVAAYRNIMEEYRTSETRPPSNPGWTRVWLHSKWLAELSEREPLLAHEQPDAKHYAVATEDDFIDVLCNDAPVIEEIEPAPADTPPPGKSRILEGDANRDEIDRIIRDVRDKS